MSYIGTDAIAEKLGISFSEGVKDQEDADGRSEVFGSNFRAPMDSKPWFDFFKEQLSDIMLIILIVAAVVSLVMSYATASKEEYGVGKYTQLSDFQACWMHIW